MKIISPVGLSIRLREGIWFAHFAPGGNPEHPDSICISTIAEAIAEEDPVLYDEWCESLKRWYQRTVQRIIGDLGKVGPVFEATSSERN